MPRFSWVSSSASDTPPCLSSARNAASSGLPAAAFSASGCSPAMLMKVTPISVSGRVVNTVSGSASPSTSNWISRPSLRPIQLRCMVLTESGQPAACPTVQQLLRVVGDAQEPLRDLALLDQRAGAPAAAVDHLLVGQHGLVDRIPVHHRVLAVGQALLQQAHEHALLVHVVVRLAGGELARPVDRVAQRLQLRAHVLDVGVGPLRRRGLVLDRGVLGRQAEGVPAHRLQHVVAGHALVRLITSPMV
jgi:hypothetical protein